MTSTNHPSALRPSQNTNDILLDLFIQQTFGSIDHEPEDWSDGITDISLREESAPHLGQAAWDYFPAAASPGTRVREANQGVVDELAGSFRQPF